LALEVFLKFTDKQFANRLQLSFTVSNAVNLNALDQNLNEGCGFGELSPGEGQGVETDTELLFAETADHHFEQANTQAVNIFKHEDFHLLSIGNSLFVLCEGPVVSFT
jgi:hypothetical protein